MKVQKRSTNSIDTTPLVAIQTNRVIITTFVAELICYEMQYNNVGCAIVCDIVIMLLCYRHITPM